MKRIKLIVLILIALIAGFALRGFLPSPSSPRRPTPPQKPKQKPSGPAPCTRKSDATSQDSAPNAICRWFRSTRSTKAAATTPSKSAKPQPHEWKLKPQKSCANLQRPMFEWSARWTMTKHAWKPFPPGSPAVLTDSTSIPPAFPSKPGNIWPSSIAPRSSPPRPNYCRPSPPAMS